MCTFSTFRSGFFTRLIFKTGLSDAVIKLLAAYTVLNMYAEFQHSCVPYETFSIIFWRFLTLSTTFANFTDYPQSYSVCMVQLPVWLLCTCEIIGRDTDVSGRQNIVCSQTDVRVRKPLRTFFYRFATPTCSQGIYLPLLWQVPSGKWWKKPGKQVHR